MTIDEKLQHFYDITVEEAKADADKAIAEHRANLDRMYQEHVTMGKKNAEAEVKSETENVRREVNKVLSAEQIHLRREWSDKQEALEEELFENVKKKVAAFKKTQGYEKYLARRINEAKEFAGEDALEIYITEEDKELKETLEKETGAVLRIAEESFVGGIRAAIPEKNILIDNSFAENLAAMRKEFTFDGGRKG